MDSQREARHDPGHLVMITVGFAGIHTNRRFLWILDLAAKAIGGIEIKRCGGESKTFDEALTELSACDVIFDRIDPAPIIPLSTVILTKVGRPILTGLPKLTLFDMAISQGADWYPHVWTTVRKLESDLRLLSHSQSVREEKSILSRRWFDSYVRNGPALPRFISDIEGMPLYATG